MFKLIIFIFGTLIFSSIITNASVIEPREVILEQKLIQVGECARTSTGVSLRLLFEETVSTYLVQITGRGLFSDGIETLVSEPKEIKRERIETKIYRESIHPMDISGSTHCSQDKLSLEKILNGKIEN